MLTKPDPACRFDGSFQLRVLSEDKRWTIAAFQPKPVPHNERIGLFRECDQSKQGFACCAFNPRVSDDAVQVLPGGKAIADRDDGVFSVVTSKQPLLSCLNLCQNGRRISRRGTPLISNQIQWRWMRTRGR